MSVQDRAARERVLAHAAKVVDRCRKCGIGSTRLNAVYGEGDPCARLMVVGEGPGETEDRTGRPFVGRAGDLLTKMLAAIDLPREAVYICNTVKCRPTLEGGGKLKNRPPDPQEMANCRPYLDEQIATIRPAVILCLGAPAAKSFLGKSFAITRQRGQWFTGPDETPLMVTFHPAFVLRQHGPALTEIKRQVWDDLKAVRSRLDAIATDREKPRRGAPVQAELF
jgi:uracil-DNA glycosylase